MPELTETQAEVASEFPDDKLQGTRTIYTVSAFEVFWRNFIAGMGRALGGIVFYLLFLFLISFLFAQILMPQLQPYVDRFVSAIDSMNQINQGQNNLDKLIESIQR